jgi:ATP-dependent RNA helicase RhlE
MAFHKLGLIEPLLRAVQSEGYTIPTAIQTQAIPHVLAGKDLLGCAQTGTGKTAAFALPILQRLSGQAPTSAAQHRLIRALVVTPTRELAAQIGESFRVYGRHTGLRQTVIFGGVKQSSQEQALRKGVDILVATPGRLLDLLNQRLLSLKHVEVFVLDEADRMLDMGFIHDIRRVIAYLPAKRQTLMFSATMPREIRTLADTILHQPLEIRVDPEARAADTVEHGLYFIASSQKPVLLEHLLQDPAMSRALIFTRTKHGADRVAQRLGRAKISAEAIHSNKSQNARLRALDNFRRGKVRVLVASDIAARGLDVDDISHVINYDLPNEPETYVHRIGRTGRAGALGTAISFCSEEQRSELRDIERLLGMKIPALECSIKLPAPVATPNTGRPQGGSRGKHSSAPRERDGHTGHSAQKSGAVPSKTGSPTQQKKAFWAGRTRRRTTVTKPNNPNRRSH